MHTRILLLASMIHAAEVLHAQPPRRNVVIALTVHGSVATDSARFLAVIRTAVEAESTLRYIVRPPPADVAPGTFAPAHYFIVTGILAEETNAAIRLRTIEVETGRIAARDSVRVSLPFVAESLQAVARRITRQLAGVPPLQRR